MIGRDIIFKLALHLITFEDITRWCFRTPVPDVDRILLMYLFTRSTMSNEEESANLGEFIRLPIIKITLIQSDSPENPFRRCQVE